MKPKLLLILLLLLIGVVEGFSWWWMHSGNTPSSPLILSYHPSDMKHEPAEPGQDITEGYAIGELIPKPEIYAKSAPMLRCSSGQVYYAKLSESSGIHFAYFEWDGKDTGSVLEAFRHLPESCMGSIGMQLVSKNPPIPYRVDETTLLFDHTVFHDPEQSSRSSLIAPITHAFRAVWVESLERSDARGGINGDDFESLRTIRFKSALGRFRPGHASVIQGAVRGISNPEVAWTVFEKQILKDLHMVKPVKSP